MATQGGGLIILANSQKIKALYRLAHSTKIRGLQRVMSAASEPLTDGMDGQFCPAWRPAAWDGGRQVLLTPWAKGDTVDPACRLSA